MGREQEAVTGPRIDVLRWIAVNAAEDRDGRDGWCRWATLPGEPWDWDDYRPLLAAGLIKKRETWKDVLLRPTDAGWDELVRPAASSPTQGEEDR